MCLSPQVDFTISHSIHVFIERSSKSRSLNPSQNILWAVYQKSSKNASWRRSTASSPSRSTTRSGRARPTRTAKGSRKQHGMDSELIFELFLRWNYYQTKLTHFFWQIAQDDTFWSPNGLTTFCQQHIQQLKVSTGWSLRLYQTTCWQQNKSSVLIWGAFTKSLHLFWCQREVWHNQNGHPVEAAKYNF